MTRKQKRMLIRIIVSALLFTSAIIVPANGIVRILLFLFPYLCIGWDILWRAARNIAHGQIFDENFLMSIASIGAFVTGECMEGTAVMLFYQVGELFQSCAVARSRKSIADLMDICPEYANVEKDGRLIQTDPSAVSVGSEIIVKPGEKIPLDGVIIEGESSLNTAALTGESVPRYASAGDEVVSGCINQTGLLRIKTTKAYDQSTVAKIIELVEASANRKANAEKFITKFARWYTPCVVFSAVLLAVIPSLFDGQWLNWIRRAMIFLVISCPCALVISVPLSFFGGIGGASRAGILIKGGNYLEVLAKAETVVFDKTGTLTRGNFEVCSVQPVHISEEEFLSVAAHAEMYSDHPAARAVVAAYSSGLKPERVQSTEEIAGRGVRSVIDQKTVLAGNAKLMAENAIQFVPAEVIGTAVYVAIDGEYAGYLVITDSVKEEASVVLKKLKRNGIQNNVILSGDLRQVAAHTAEQIGADEVHAELLPADKVECLEKILSEKHTGSVLFVGDGINDAPVLSRADVGIAMGAMGSDAAIEAADVVLMNDDLNKIPQAIRIARKTMRIVYQNIVFAIGVKVLIMILGAVGEAGMWAAVFADVGVAVIAILNASRALRIPHEE